MLYQKERGQVRHQLWIGVLLLVCVTSEMRAQTGGLKGVVTDTTGAPVPGAQVAVSNDSGISKLVTTGETGAYLVNGLVPGTYSVKASFPGMQS
ncbi:MAG TPA: carboxypeptidase-like regulatory domain-containing protein, partial [Bryobacteraceae bacterium]|nr:carboxypeptidase-like regulatory domain-containing protein [Bryobacteraceae bacterium]